MKRSEIGPELSIDPPKPACYLSLLPPALDKNVRGSIPADRVHHRFERERARLTEIMSEQEEQSKGFKVTDRRSFTREGERIAARDDEEHATENRPTAAAEPGFSAEPAGKMEPRFLDLLSLLATQASLALGAPHPVTGEPHEDLEVARTLISMLEVLRTKTKGNLSRDEQAALEEILYQLRLDFMDRAKAAKS